MKKHILLSLPFLFLGLSVFAGTTEKDPAVINGLKSKVGVVVNFPAAQQEAAVVKIVDRSNAGETVFTETYQPQTYTSRTYNLAQLPAGKYEISVATGEQQVKQAVRIYFDGNVKSYEFMNQ
ncbi:MAG: hypothetical protein INR69_06520 [Mucilaginibacter polytrichastri]|nr:hypothetical protein [Mucilaginibacter polytrichastri]